jgi:hypothetical protein
VLGELGERMRTPQPSELAWIAVVPCAIVTLAAIVLLGPPIGHAFFSPGSETLWPPEAGYVFGQPEPVKQGRYLAALLGPALLTAAVYAGRRRRLALQPAVVRSLVVASQAAVLAFLVVCFVAESRRAAHDGRPPMIGTPTIAVAAVLALGFTVAARSTRVLGGLARLARETRARRMSCAAVAIAVTAAWLLTAVDSEGSIGHAQAFGLMAWSFDDPFAILNGRTTIVDFHALYAQLVPYAAAVAMRVFGTTVTVYTLTLTAMSGLALLAIYAIFRRLTRSAPLALALYLPFLAMGFLYLVGPPESHLRLTNAQVLSVWPMRYGGGYLLAWLTFRHIDGTAPRRAWMLFLVAGLVVINNLEFGLGALAATILALACARPPRSRRAAARSAGGAAIGLLGAALLVSLLTLARAGRLPRFGLLLEFPRLFSTVGLVSSPMATLGLHLAVYVTFVTAIATAIVRVASGAEDRLLTGMLAWSGAFGLIAGSYFVGRADTFKLTALFSAWFLAIALLAIAAVRELAARNWRPNLPELAVLFGFGLAICALAETPAPWSQISRLGRTTAPALRQPAAVRFVTAHTRPHEHIAILLPLGHRIAYEAGVTNVSPYSFLEEIATRRQFQTVIDDMRRTHAHKIFMPDWFAVPAHFAALTEAGFSQEARQSRFSMWSDDG